MSVLGALLVSASDQELDALAAALAPRLGADSEPSPERLLSVEEVAAHLLVDGEWVRRHQATLGGFKLSEGRNGPVRFRLGDVERFLESRRLRPPRSGSRGWRDDPDWAAG